MAPMNKYMDQAFYQKQYVKKQWQIIVQWYNSTQTSILIDLLNCYRLYVAYLLELKQLQLLESRLHFGTIL